MVELLETHFKDVVGFDKDLLHVEDGSKVTIAQIRMGLVSIRDSLKGIQDLLGLIDKGKSASNKKTTPQGVFYSNKFQEIMQSFYDKSYKIYEKLDQRFKKAEADYEKAVVLYGEDPKTSSPEEFFGIFAKFNSAYVAAKQENEAAIAKEIELKKREEAQKVSKVCVDEE